MRTHTSPSNKFALLRQRWVQLVQANGEVTKGDIILKLGLDPYKYSLNAGAIAQTTESLMSYDKPSQTWTWIGKAAIEKEVVEEEEIPVEKEEISHDEEVKPTFEDVIQDAE